MYYVSADSTGLCSFDIKEKKTASITGSVFTTGQGDFNIVGDILVYLNREKMEICTLDTESGRVTAKDGNGGKIRIILTPQLCLMERTEFACMLSQLHRV